MIRVAYVINSIKRNGPSNVILNLINNMDKKEFNVTLVTLFNENDPNIVSELKRINIKVIECGYSNRLKFLLTGIKRFEKLMISRGFDVIHSHGFIPDIISGKMSTNIKKVSTIHSIMFEDYSDTYGYLRGKFYALIHLKYLMKLDCCVCCSETVFKRVGTYIPNVTYIRNGLDCKPRINSVTRDSLGIPENALVFIYVGRLEQGKNVAYLVNEFHRYHKSNEYLLLVGDGTERGHCINLSDENIKVLGFKEEPAAYMQISDIYTSASKSEGFSISILEALDSGLALMVSDIPSHKEVFSIDKSVYLGEVFSFDQYKTQLEKIRTKVSTINQNEIMRFKEKHLSAKSMSVQYMEIYKKGQ